MTSLQNRMSTPSSLFVISGPGNRISLREISLYLAEQLNTTMIFLWFVGMINFMGRNVLLRFTRRALYAFHPFGVVVDEHVINKGFVMLEKCRVFQKLTLQVASSLFCHSSIQRQFNLRIAHWQSDFIILVVKMANRGRNEIRKASLVS